MKITMIDLEIRMFDDENAEETLRPEDVFAVSPKGTRALTLSIYSADWDFLTKAASWNPQSVPPIKLLIEIPMLDMYAYDLDF